MKLKWFHKTRSLSHLNREFLLLDPDEWQILNWIFGFQIKCAAYRSGDNLISMNPDLFMSTLISKKFLRFVYKVWTMRWCVFRKVEGDDERIKRKRGRAFSAQHTVRGWKKWDKLSTRVLPVAHVEQYLTSGTSIDNCLTFLNGTILH